MRIYCKNLVGRMYEKFSTFLRVEVCVNRMKDLGLNKGLKNLEALRQKLIGIAERFAGFEAQSLNVHIEFPLFQKIALPVMSGKTKIAGIKIHDTRMRATSSRRGDDFIRICGADLKQLHFIHLASHSAKYDQRCSHSIRPQLLAHVDATEP